MKLNWDRLLVSLLCLAGAAAGQTTSSITVQLLAPDSSAIPAGAVRLENRATGFSRELTAQGDGLYTGRDLPPQTYRLTAAATGFRTEVREVVLRGNVPVNVDVVLAVSTVEEQVTVGASETLDLVDTQATGTRVALALTAMEEIPAPVGNRGLERVLLTFPGFAANANGAIHPRGAHNQMTYVIDGMPISDQMTGAFATALDPAIVTSVELYTGDVPAEFGSKVSGVAVVSTRSGSGAGRKWFGTADFGGGSFDTVQSSVQAGGERGRLGWFVAVSGAKSNRFLDQVSLDNLHNGGNAERAFMRLDYRLSDRDGLRFNAMGGRSSFELANLRSQHRAGMDQRQLLRDGSLWLHWNRILNPSSTWESTVAWRPSVAQMFPSAGDTPVTSAQARHLDTVTVTNRFNRVAGAHSIRAGVDLQRFRISENFSMGITDGSFNRPEVDGYNDGLAPFDLTRGGRLFQFSDRSSGLLASAFAQDSVKWRRWLFSLGARFDEYRFLVDGRQFQPRVGVAFHLRETGTVLRASYNRNYQTPPNENLLLSSSEAAAQLAPESVRQALGGVVTPLRPQRENVYEAGLEQSLFGRAKLNAAVYHKDSRDQQDNNNFFNTGVIFPVTLASIRVNGAEGRIVLPPVRGLNATLSATHSRAVTTPPFTGGLFLGQEAIDLLSAGPFVIDHDQKLSVSLTAHYTINRNWWVSGVVRYDSGLVANPTTPEDVLADPDYSDLLPLVDLAGNPARVRPRTVTDISIGYQRRHRQESARWDVQAQAGNITDTSALYNFQSVFVGTRGVPPRSIGAKFRFFW